MKTLIVGGGLSGLALALTLEEQGRDYLLIDARDRLGGRIETFQHGSGAYDLGPAWFWPDQPRMAALIERLGLEKFDQYAEGNLTFEDENGHVQRGPVGSSMQGSWRLKGSFGALVSALVARLPENKIRMNAPVKLLTLTDTGIAAQFGSGETVAADKVVLALPPRIAADLVFSPALPTNVLSAMQDIPTWMAGQAKAVAVYDTPFWRIAGLSGDAMSRHGPMVELHDASPMPGRPYALFGFIGLPPQHRSNVAELRQHVLAQLTRLFGPNAATPLSLHVKDWAFDPYTSTQTDHRPLYAHPAYGLPKVMKGLWDNRLLFGGTEVATQFGGYLEGALESAEAVAAIL